MNGQRAIESLSGFTQGQLAFTAKEIDELIKAQLVAEVRPFDYQTLQWLITAITDAGHSYDDPELVAKLEAHLGELDARLASDWHRFTTTRKHIDEEDKQRRAIRRILGHLKDPIEMARLRTIAPGAAYLKCPALGDELYAITARGQRVRDALAQRIDRYREAPLAAFVKAFDKTDVKMAAFAGEISVLSNNIGYVKKNPHQVVIGLAKTGKPAGEAVAEYRSHLRTTGAPDVAVTLARNEDRHGGAAAVSERLQTAVGLLQRAGFPRSPVTFGAAKTLLAFEPLEAGVKRFSVIAGHLQHAAELKATSELNVKLTARLMPAEGTPEELVRRAAIALAALHQTPSRVHPIHEKRGNAVAIASMVRSADQIGPLVFRHRALEVELVRSRVSSPQSADGDALEAIACPGTPMEVAATVHALMAQIATTQGRDPQPGDAAIAVAFAKRFAY